MRRAIAVLLVMVPLAFVGCAPSGGEFAGLVPPEALAKADLQYYWHVKVQLHRGEEIASLHLAGDRLYCLTDRNRLLALDAARGVWLWTQPLPPPPQRAFAPVNADKVSPAPRLRLLPSSQPSVGKAVPLNAVVLNTLSEILVIDRSTGELAARIPFDFPACTGGAVDVAPDESAAVDQYFLASSRGWYYAINLNNGLQDWSMSTGGFISSPPAFYGGVVYVGGEDGVLYATKSGRYADALWNSRNINSQQMHGPVTAPIYVDARGCFVPCQDNRLYAFDRLTGRPLWEPFVCQQPLQDAVQVGRDSIFQLARRDGFYAIDIANGQQRWSIPQGRMVLAVMSDKTSRVYLLDSLGNLRVVEEMTGKVETILPIRELDRFTANTSVPAIYAATHGGHIVCIRPGSVGYLTPEEFKQRQY